jgi:aldose 1-epimerase
VTSPTVQLADDDLLVDIAPAAGGRIAQISADGIDLLVARASRAEAEEPIGWGCFPMVPWAGRVRHGDFEFAGERRHLAVNFGDHAIHGVGFDMAWDVVATSETSIELALALPTDERWPFGGRAHQRIVVRDGAIRLELDVTAAERAFPAAVGWHPWFRKPQRLEFHPAAMYQRDDDGIALDELVAVPPPPWDDCFENDRPVVIELDGRIVRLTSDCPNWVVYDERPYATCIEPQTAPPDAFNHRPQVVRPGSTLGAWYQLELSHKTD